MKTCLIILSLLLPILLLGQAAISFSFANNQITTGGTYFEFDVLAASAPDTNMAGIQVYFDYSTAAFGNLIFPANATVTTPVPTNYFLTVNNTFANTLSMALNLQYGSFFVLTSIPAVVFHVKILIADPEETSGITFNQLMTGQQFYIPPEGGFASYGDIYYGDGLDETLPVELSSFTAVMTSTLDGVTLTWITQSESNLTGYYIFRNEIQELVSASRINELMSATNTSQPVTYTYTDSEILENTTYWYWLQSVEMDGTSAFHGPVSLTVPQDGGDTPPVIPLITDIANAYPNPFVRTLKIDYALKKADHVQLCVTNTKGQVVRTLVSDNKDAGIHPVSWDGKDDNGRNCTSGMYFLKMTVGNKAYTRKVIMVK
ncbi:MAG: FlgD immunoglobulin-like domain containing protein [Candidatus Cloacimonadaceae bacterium]